MSAAFDWEAPDAYAKWELSKAEYLREVNRLPREVLEQVNATASFQADRAIESFLKAADAMAAWRDLALKAIELLRAERKAKTIGKLTDALLEPMREAEAMAVRISTIKRGNLIFQSKGGKTTAVKNKAEAQVRTSKLHGRADKLLENHPKREISGILEREGSWGSRTSILKKLRSHPSRLWKK